VKVCNTSFREAVFPRNLKHSLVRPRLKKSTLDPDDLERAAAVRLISHAHISKIKKLNRNENENAKRDNYYRTLTECPCDLSIGKFAAYRYRTAIFQMTLNDLEGHFAYCQRLYMQFSIQQYFKHVTITPSLRTMLTALRPDVR